MMACDYIIDLGSWCWKAWWGYSFTGNSLRVYQRSEFLTASYLSGKASIEIPAQRRKGNGQFLSLIGAKGHNLKNLSLKFPLGCFICVTGVSGSGKSSLINETLYPILREYFYNSLQKPLSFDKIDGLEHLE
jgi:excinuclease ABC subunit A